MKKITMLTNADIRKVDLVPAGAQQLSKITIMKGGETSMSDKVNKLSDKELEDIQNLLDEIKAKLEIVEEDENTKESDTKEEKNDECVNENNQETEKANECVKEEGVSEDNVETKDTENKEEPKEVKEESVKEDDTKEVKEGECVNEETPEVKEALKKAADAQAEADRLKDQIAKMEDERVTKEFIQKASELGNIPGISTDELGSVLKSINKSVDADTYKKIEELLKSANDIIGTGSMFIEKGTSAQSTGEPTSADEAWQMIEKLAEQRVTKGLSNTGNCVSDVLDTPEGSALYIKYKSLRGGN